MSRSGNRRVQQTRVRGGAVRYQGKGSCCGLLNYVPICTVETHTCTRNHTRAPTHSGCQSPIPSRLQQHTGSTACDSLLWHLHVPLSMNKRFSLPLHHGTVQDGEARAVAPAPAFTPWHGMVQDGEARAETRARQTNMIPRPPHGNMLPHHASTHAHTHAPLAQSCLQGERSHPA